jgi:hypothetical protein
MKKTIAALILAIVISPMAKADIFAIVNTNTGAVENVIEYPSQPSTPPPGMASNYIAVPIAPGVGPGWNYINGTFTNPNPPPAPTAAQIAAAKYGAAIAAGMNITSSSTSSLNGTYAIDPTSQQRVAAISLYIQVNGKFPAGQSSLPWPDAAGTPHAFATPSQFQAFATAMGDYVALLSIGQTPSPVVIP